MEKFIKENISAAELEEEKQKLKDININLKEWSAGIIITKNKDEKFNFGIWGNGTEIVQLLFELEERIPEDLLKIHKDIRKKAKEIGTKYSGLEAETPAHRTIN